TRLPPLSGRAVVPERGWHEERHRNGAGRCDRRRSEQGGRTDETRHQEGGVSMTGAGAAPPEARVGQRPDRRFSLREAARILEVPEARLRVLARAGLLAPQRGPIGPLSFGFQDLLVLRTTKGLLASGVPMRRTRKLWSSPGD